MSFCDNELICNIKRSKNKDNDEYYFLNYFCSFQTKNKFESHKSVCKNHDFCNTVMLEKK